MSSFTRNTRRVVLAGCVAGAAVLGAVGVGTAAFADGAPTPAASQSATAPAAVGQEGGPAVGPKGGPEAGPKGGPEQGKHEPHIGGTVLTVSGSTITVQDHEGFTRTIVLADGATVTKDQKASSASAITKGEHVEATGTVASDKTTLNATAVRIGEPQRPDGGRGPGGKQGQAATPPKGAPAAPKSGSSDAPAAPTPPSGAPSAPTGAPSASTGS